MQIKTLLLSALIASNVFAFEISELPSITERKTPDGAINTIYSYHNSIKEAKNAVVNISTQKKVTMESNPMLNKGQSAQFSKPPFL